VPVSWYGGLTAAYFLRGAVARGVTAEEHAGLALAGFLGLGPGAVAAVSRSAVLLEAGERVAEVGRWSGRQLSSLCSSVRSTTMARNGCYLKFALPPVTA
jgi:hypothetical protein